MILNIVRVQFDKIKVKIGRAAYAPGCHGWLVHPCCGCVEDGRYNWPYGFAWLVEQ